MSVRVVARIRPLLKSELDKDTIVSADSPSEGTAPSIVRIPNPKNLSEDFSFQFNSVYGSSSTQQDIFDGEVAPTVKHLFNGFDVTLFAYGVTGTGKTHTMRGGKSLADRGVIPRLLSGIYRRARKIERDSVGRKKVDVAMSYYEIYNDKVFDLFESPEKRTASGLALRDNGGNTVVVGLTERPCESLKDFEKLYDQANVNRSTGATKLNAHSSRSHAILCVKITVTDGEETRVSRASAIDLAGSEDNRRTENNKERLVESSSINKSLFVLAQCVEAISKKASRIPYRESKMTRILCLGQNNGLTIMVLNLAPVRSYHLDTLSSLNFANRTKKIEVREVENEPIFKGCARPVAVGASLQRQPLRPLTSANHNANVRKPTDAPAKANGKPAKAFAVYADKSRSSLNGQGHVAPRRSSPLKRPSDPLKEGTRPFKVARSDQPMKKTQTITKSTIEDMVEKKVTEILAARAMNQTISAPADVGDDVKRRLESLEQRIENQDDSRTEGLNYLLMAKQHQVRGELNSALKMFELAKEFFPENQRLATKIMKLRAKIQEKNTTAKQIDMAFASPFATGSKNAQRSQERRSGTHDDDYQYATDADDDHDYQPEVRSRQHMKAKNTRIKVTPFAVEEVLCTPRTKRLLAIVNTRDVDEIRLLRGVGAKKAETIVEALRSGVEEANFNEVQSLQQLASLKGISTKAVETMRIGLSVGQDFDF